MTAVFQSGAFIQQCFSVHPLALSVKRFKDPQRLLLSCRSCKMLHHLTVTDVMLRTPASAQPLVEPAPLPIEGLTACVESHPAAVSIRDMDVLRDAIGMRCAECRRLYDLTVAAFETHQR